MMHGRSVDDSGGPMASFRWEMDMLGPIAGSVGVLMRHLPGRGSPDVRFEVASATGVPDVIAVRWHTGELRRRQQLGLPPVLDVTRMRALTALSAGSLTSAALAAACGVSVSHVRRTVVPQLIDDGWVAGARAHSGRGPGALVRPLVRHRPLVGAVVTVEAKRSAWKQAFAQARRHRACSDAAYVALDAAWASVAVRFADEMSACGVGLLTVDAASGRVRVVSRPAIRGATRDADRRLIAERAWGLQLAGARSGVVSPVFGRDLVAAAGGY